MDTPPAQSADDLSAMSLDQLDALPFGAIRLTSDGTILSYNATESQISGCDPALVIGKNFFTEVAPCTAVRSFHGVFLELIAHRAVNRHFDFTFPFQPPIHVRITMLYEQHTQTVWVLVARS